MTFENLKLIDPILRALKEEGYASPTPIQEQSIPVLLQGKDLIGCAQTGTGKTAAFTIPILQTLYNSNHKKEIKALVLTPTRELAIQIGESFEAYGKYTGLRHTVIFGGVKQKQQTDELRRGSSILIATPGRLLDLIEQGFVSLKALDFFVLDEADRMLDMGFYEDIMQVVNRLPKDRQTIMFSATMPPKIRLLAKTILNNPVEVKIAVSRPPETIMQTAYICHEAQKPGIVRQLFSSQEPNKVIIFSGSKLKVKEITKTFRSMGLSVGEMHSDLDQSQRDHVMHEFKNSRVNILVATDIVSRGIDIDDISLVINYDVPHDAEDYVHRIGRTARAKAEGMSITFVSEEDQHRFKQIEDFLEKDIYKIPVPAELGEAPEYNPQLHRFGHKKFSSGKGKFHRNKNRK